MAEPVSAVIPLLVAPARVDDVLVLLHLRVDVGHEGRVDLEHRQDGVAVDGIALHLIQHFQRVGKGLRMVREQGQHLLLALEELLLRVAHPVRIIDERFGREADQPVMDRAVLLPDEMNVVGGKDFHMMLLGHLEDDLVVDHLVVIDLLRKPRDLRLVEHHLQVIVLSEDLLVPFDDFVHLAHVPGQDGPRHLARHAGGTADQVLMVLLEHLMAHAGTVVEALDMARGDDLHEVLVAVVVLRQQDQVIIPLLLHPMVALGHVDLAADDGLHVRMLLRILEEFLHPVHVAVVRNGEAGHPEFLGPVEQVLDGRLSVEDGILGMDVKVYESHGATSLG